MSIYEVTTEAGIKYEIEADSFQATRHKFHIDFPNLKIEYMLFQREAAV